MTIVYIYNKLTLVNIVNLKNIHVGTDDCIYVNSTKWFYNDFKQMEKTLKQITFMEIENNDIIILKI